MKFMKTLGGKIYSARAKFAVHAPSLYSMYSPHLSFVLLFFFSSAFSHDLGLFFSLSSCVCVCFRVSIISSFFFALQEKKTEDATCREVRALHKEEQILILNSTASFSLHFAPERITDSIIISNKKMAN